jgi:hypothetical protein
MECLEGRKVHYVYGAHHGEEEGVIVEDRGKGFALNNDQLVAVLVGDRTIKYHAKWRLLTAEYPWGEVPTAVGVYLLAEGV